MSTQKLFINSVYPSIRFVWGGLWIEYRPGDHYYKWPVIRRGRFEIWLVTGTLRISTDRF